MKTSSEKILTIEKLKDLLPELKGQGKKIVLCHGVFDLLHPGHLKHLNAARREGDILVVTITPDHLVNKGPGRPVFAEKLRAEFLAALSVVDFVAVNLWWTAVETIHALKPNVYVKGGEYRDRPKNIVGKISLEEDAVRQVGGRVVYTDEVTFSSSSLANQFFDLYSDETNDFLNRFRQSLKPDELLGRLSALSKLRVLVIGDAIIDEYQYCTPMAKSPKEYVITTRYLSQEVFAGGALAAANHCANFCDHIDLITTLGENDSREEFVRSHLKPNIHPHLFIRKGLSTVVKRRFVEPNFIRKLFQISILDDTLAPYLEEEAILGHLERTVSDYDLVLVADFGHGMISSRMIDLLAKKARFLAVMAQTNSANLGFNPVTKYPRADYVCIDEPEVRLACQDNMSLVEDLSVRISERLKAGHVVVTQGNRGCTGYSKAAGKFFKVPTLSQKIVDTIGAGDAFLSVSAPCIADGMPLEMACFVGNAAGSLAVGTVGNRTAVEKVSLYKFITALLK